MIAFGYAYIGSSRVECPDCRDLIEVPHDYSWPACNQPPGLRRLRREIITEHALARVILHPTLLPDLHRMAARR